MGDRVPVVRRRQVLVRADRIDGLEAARVAGDDAVLDELIERAADAVTVVQVEVARRRQVAAADVVEEVLQRDDDLVDALRAVAAAEERQRHEGRRRDRRHPVDARRHLERELLQRQILLVGVGLGVGVRRAHDLRQRERVAEPQVDRAVTASQVADDLQEPPEVLALLLRAALLGRVVADVLDLVVRDRDRDQMHVLALAAAVGVDDVREEPEARRQQLARARAAALDVPLEREALLDQVVDVVVQHELVDGVVLERPADEEHAAPAHERPHREEVHVDAARRVIRRVAVLVEKELQDRVVEVRLVRRQEDDREAARDGEDLLELLLVVVHRVGIRAAVGEPEG